MKLRALRFLLRKEFLQIRRDHVILGMLFGMPLVQLLLAGRILRIARLGATEAAIETCSR
jgi:hypothetical protein